jgi:hypothetical protein
MQATMVISMREGDVDRYVQRATADMYRNNRMDIRCPCRRCKLGSLFDPYSGKVKEHLLRYSFMEGHTQWMSDDEGDDDHGHEVENDEDHGEQDHNEDGVEDAAHDDDGEEGGEHVDDEVRNRNTPLTAAVQDPHVQELLLSNTSNHARAADRRKSKLEQLEVDSRTPLYDAGRGPEESRLRVTLDILEMKAKFGWSDISADTLFRYLKIKFPKDNTCAGSLNEAKKIVCPLDLPHEKYHACINDCVIYRNEHADETTCPVCEESRYKRGTKKSPWGIGCG